MKRAITLLLAILMIFSLLAPMVLANEDDASEALSARHTFTDVKDHWAIDAIAFMFARNLMQGTTPTTFEPDALFTRAQAAMLLYRIVDEPPVTGAAPFNDVAPGQWCSAAIAWAYQGNIVQGVGNGLFAPDDPITREQMVTLLYRFAAYQGQDMTVAPDFILDFPDANQISPWAESAMGWAVYFELLQGADTGLLHPLNTTTRAEAAVMLTRFVEKRMLPPLPPLCPELAMRIKQAYLRQWQESGGSQEYTVDDLRITFSAVYSIK